jgi:hypothetical protein
VLRRRLDLAFVEHCQVHVESTNLEQ